MAFMVETIRAPRCGVIKKALNFGTLQIPVDSFSETSGGGRMAIEN